MFKIGDFARLNRVSIKTLRHHMIRWDWCLVRTKTFELSLNANADIMQGKVVSLSAHGA